MKPAPKGTLQTALVAVLCFAVAILFAVGFGLQLREGKGQQLSLIEKCEQAGGIPRAGGMRYRGCDFPPTSCTDLYDLLQRLSQ